MTTLLEGTQRFEFPAGWEVVKFDETVWFRQHFGGQLKGVDILARYNDQHWWLEIKDCAGSEPENRPRLAVADPVEIDETRKWLKEKGYRTTVRLTRYKPFIIDELMEKFCDTLVSLSFAKRANEPVLANYSAWCGSDQVLTVVLQLTWDVVDFKRLAKLLQQKLNTALHPYGLRGFVVGESLQGSGMACKVSRVSES